VKLANKRPISHLYHHRLLYKSIHFFTARS